MAPIDAIRAGTLNGARFAPRRRPRAPFWFAESGGEGWAAGATKSDTRGHDSH
jgi:hypothetical protein